MARDQQRRLRADEETRAQVEAAASRIVGELFAERGLQVRFELPLGSAT